MLEERRYMNTPQLVSYDHSLVPRRWSGEEYYEAPTIIATSASFCACLLSSLVWSSWRYVTGIIDNLQPSKIDYQQ